MNKLIGKIKTSIMLRDIGAKNDLETIERLEQITDDFSVKLLIWIGENVKLLDDKSGYLKAEDIFLSTTELQQYFKDNIYGKE